MAISEARRLRPVAVATRRHTALPTAAAVLAGAALAVQAYDIGRLGRALGSPELAGVLNFVVGLALLAVILLVTGAAARAIRALRAPRGLRPWHLLGGLGGALFIVAATEGAPELGLALFSVAVVCGQASGSLVADRAGLSPAGRQPASPQRVAGAALAVAAVAVIALGGKAEVAVGLLVLAVVAGFGQSLQQAANGHVARATGEALVAGAMSFAVGLVAIVVYALVTAGTTPPNGWGAGTPLEYAAGVLGAGVASTLAATVGRLGVLRLMLALTAGQVAGGLVIDLVAPAPGEAVTIGTVAGVALAFAAVLVSGAVRPGGGSGSAAR